uniref:Uncharacterized protein n=1 Tax=Rhizophora mucronata TaxID=61149 RepID=A0A2P2P7I8_RHIMU
MHKALQLRKRKPPSFENKKIVPTIEIK